MNEALMNKYIYCWMKRNCITKLHICEKCCTYLLRQISVFDMGNDNMIIHSEFNIDDVSIIRLKTSFIMNKNNGDIISVYNDIHELYACNDKKVYDENAIYHRLWYRLNNKPEIHTDKIIKQIPNRLAYIIYRVYCTDEFTQFPEKYYTFLLCNSLTRKFPKDIAKIIANKILFASLYLDPKGSSRRASRAGG